MVFPRVIFAESEATAQNNISTSKTKKLANVFPFTQIPSPKIKALSSYKSSQSHLEEGANHLPQIETLLDLGKGLPVNRAFGTSSPITVWVILQTSNLSANTG